MREQPVLCRNATRWEADQEPQRHITWEDDGICKPCKRTLAKFAKRRAEHETPVEIRTD